MGMLIVSLTCTHGLLSLPRCVYVCVFTQTELDPAAIAHAHVYYEKLVMMVNQISHVMCGKTRFSVGTGPQGKVIKSTRKVLAGVCLLLAAKFATDMKKTEISNLIEVSEHVVSKCMPDNAWKKSKIYWGMR